MDVRASGVVCPTYKDLFIFLQIRLQRVMKGHYQTTKEKSASEKAFTDTTQSTYT